MNRRTFIKGAAAALGPIAAGTAYGAQQPNVVLIFADDLGYGDLSSYGSHIKTPHLDAMATEGVQFRQFYSANPVCSPSRASILTGRYGVRCGVPGVLQSKDPGGLAESEVTIAQMLKQVGYKTMCVGKWHLGCPDKYLPTTRGFDEYYGIPYSNDMLPSVLMHNKQVIESPVDLPSLTMRYTDQAVDFIRRSKNSPFFLYLAHAGPHIPLTPSPAFLGKSGLGLYGDVVQELDWSVGKVLAALAENGLDENTLVIFTSDNGPWYQGSPGRLRGRKGETFEGGMRVPFIARYPAQIASGGGSRRPGRRVVDSMATTMDLLPTIAAFTHAPLPGNALDGVDISAVLTGHETEARREVFLYFIGWELQAARLGPYKLHVSRFNAPAYAPYPMIGLHNYPLLRPELYDLESDPEEAFDISLTNPDIVADLLKRVKQMLPTLPIEVQTAWNDTQSLSSKVYPNEPGAYPTPIFP
ncbi:MAG: sulfatase [Bryobacteraceae bacterium]